MFLWTTFCPGLTQRAKVNPSEGEPTLSTVEENIDFQRLGLMGLVFGMVLRNCFSILNIRNNFLKTFIME